MTKTQPVYRAVLAQAFVATWKEKSLWMWGLFAALVGNVGEYQTILNAIERVSTSAGVPIPLGFSIAAPSLTLRTARSLGEIFVDAPGAVVGLLIVGTVFAAVAAFFVWLSVTSVAVLVRSGGQLAAKKSLSTPAAMFDASREFFPPLLITFLFGKIVVWMLLALVALFGALALLDPYFGIPSFVVAFLLLVPAAVSISFVVRYMVPFIVLKKCTVLESLERSVTLLKSHWLVTGELAILLGVVSALAGGFVLILVWLLVVPAFLSASVLWQLGFTVWAMIVAMLSLAFLIAVLFFFASVLATFQWMAWTMLFTRLQLRSKTVSKIVRLLGRFLPDTHLRLLGRR